MQGGQQHVVAMFHAGYHALADAELAGDLGLVICAALRIIARFIVSKASLQPGDLVFFNG